MRLHPEGQQLKFKNRHTMFNNGLSCVMAFQISYDALLSLKRLLTSGVESGGLESGYPQ